MRMRSARAGCLPVSGEVGEGERALVIDAFASLGDDGERAPPTGDTTDTPTGRLPAAD
jgi:hypothetical protein